MSIRDWPDGERPREKLAARGAGSLSDAELLAVFIGSGRRGQSAVDLGRGLLTASGGLKPLLEAATRQAGLGAVAWCRLQAALEVGRRYLDAELREADSLTDPAASARYLKARLGGYPYEVFACLFLDNRHRVIAFEDCSALDRRGQRASARSRAHCLATSAAVIFAHNHPPASPNRAARIARSRAPARCARACRCGACLIIRHRQWYADIIGRRGWI